MICINPETIIFTAVAIANNFLVLAIVAYLSSQKLVDLTTGEVNEEFF